MNKASHAERRVLVISSATVAQSLSATLDAAGFVTRGVRRPEDAPGVAATWQPEVVLFDIGDAELDVVELTKQIRRAASCLFVHVVDTHTSESLTRALASGVDAVAERAFVVDEIDRVMAQCAGAPRSVGKADAEHVTVLEQLVGCSAPMAEVWRGVARCAGTSSPVLITGETGAGKEVVARALHRLSPRHQGPFVAVNCAALPDTLVESELFGHEKGAFTGAVGNHAGRFELANKGTLLLDEIGDLPLPAQAKLLRVLQDSVVERVGGTAGVPVDVRVIAATNRNLEDEIRGGRFRADLFYRLNVLGIRVPALRERQADILPLWRFFMQRAAAARGRAVVPGLTREAQGLLLTYPWPGNVRELQNVVERVAALGRGDEVDVPDLPDAMRGGSGGLVAHRLSLAGMSMRDIERSAILATYEVTGNVADTAAMLGISVRKAYYRLKQYRSALADTGQPAPLPRVRQVLRVVLAEDDDDVRVSLAELLRLEGFEVVDVANGSDVLRHLGTTAGEQDSPAGFDVLITDLRMPGLNGLRLLEGIRVMGWKIPVIVISAFGDDETREEAMKLGASAFLEKPIDSGRLIEEVSSLS